MTLLSEQWCNQMLRMVEGYAVTVALMAQVCNIHFDFKHIQCMHT